MPRLTLTGLLLSALITGCGMPPPPGIEEIEIPAFEPPKPLRLYSEDGTSIREPTLLQIEQALAALDGEENRFALLATSREAGSYLETYFDPDSGLYELEYQVEEAERRFQAVHPTLDLEDVVDVFSRYARDDESWARCCSWERMSRR